MKPPEAPPLPTELLGLLKRMRLPYLRRAAPEVCATARAQRWDPAEILRVLLAEEVKGRDEANQVHPAQGGRLPLRQDLRQLASSGLLYPTTDSASIDDVGVGGPGRELGGLWAQRHRQEPLL